MVGSQGARYAGTRARNLARDPEEAAQALEQRHMEAAEQMVETLGRMKGAAMKIGQLASFIDTEFLPPEYRELYQDKLATLRSTAPPMPWKKVRAVLDEEWEEPVEELFEDFEHDAAAAASIGQVHRAVLPGRAARGGEGAVPRRGLGDRGRHAERRADPAARQGVRARARRQGRGRGAEGARDGGARLRARGAVAARVRARLPAPPVHPRARRGHAAVHRARAGERVGGRRRLRRGARAAPARARPLRRDRVPLLLRLDLPPPALQRRRPPRQLPAAARRARGVPRLRDDEAPRPGPDRAGDRGARGDLRRRPRAAARGAPRPRLPERPAQGGRRAADGPRAGGGRLVHGGPRGHDRLLAGDGGDRGGVGPALGLLPRDAAREPARQRADGTAHGVGRAGRAGPARAPRATGTGSAASGGSASRRPPSSASRSAPGPGTRAAGGPRTADSLRRRSRRPSRR